MAQGKFILTAQDKTKTGVNSAKNNLKELSEVANGLGINLGKLTQVGVVTAALAGLAKGASECVNAFLKTENTYLALKSTLGDTKSYNNAITSINNLAKTTTTTRDSIAKLYTELAQLGKGEDEINKILEASISLANVTGKDLNSAMELLLSTYQGSAGELTKYLPMVAELTAEELKLGKALDVVNENLGETGKKVAIQSYTQSIKNIKDDLQGIGESLGSLLVNSLGSAFTYIEEFLSHIDTELKKVASRSQFTQQYPEQAKAFNQMQTRGYTASYALEGKVNSVSDAVAIMQMAETLDLNSFKERKIYYDILDYIKKIYPNIEELVAQAEKSNYNKFNGTYSTSTQTTSDFVKVSQEILTGITADLDSAMENISTDSYEAIVQGSEDLTKVMEKWAGAMTNMSAEEKQSALTYYADMRAVLQNLANELKQKAYEVANSLLSSSASSYLTDSQYAEYLKYVEEGFKESLNKAIADLNKTGQGDSTEAQYLRQIVTNLNAGLDKSIPTNIKAILSANTKYYDEESKKAYEISTLESTISSNKTLLEEGFKQLALGNGKLEDLQYLAKIVDGQEKELEELKKSSTSTSTSSLSFDDIGSTFASAFEGVAAGADNAILGDLTSGFNDLFDALGPVVDILLSSDPLMALLMELIGQLCTSLAPFIEQVMAPLNDVLTSVVQVLTDLIVPILEPLKGVMGAIGAILKAVLLPTLQLLAPIMQIIVAILDVLKPLLEVLAVAFGYVGTVIDLIATSLQWVIAKVINWFASWVPWVNAVEEPEAPSWDKSYNKIMGSTMYDFNQGYSGFSDDTSTNTSVNTAKYQGASTFYFNIYQQAPVVGEGGMQEFAIMLKKEFAELAYIGA